MTRKASKITQGGIELKKLKPKPKRRGRPPSVEKVPMHMFGLRVPLKDWSDWTAHCDRLGVASLGGRLVDLVRKDTASGAKK